MSQIPDIHGGLRDIGPHRDTDPKGLKCAANWNGFIINYTILLLTSLINFGLDTLCFLSQESSVAGDLLIFKYFFQFYLLN